MSALDSETREQYREIFEERAGIMEHDGKQLRSRAEITARIEADTWLDKRLVAQRDSGVQR
jgi:hypothetical protein